MSEKEQNLLNENQSDDRAGSPSVNQPDPNLGHTPDSIWTPGQSLPAWSLPLVTPCGSIHFTVYGGPYFTKPEGYFGVKLAPEINLPCSINLPISDFSIPETSQALSAVMATIDALFNGEKVFAGCYGGKGRTGLFLALLAKTFGYERPITHVREHYHAHAVETREQGLFIYRFDVAPARNRLNQRMMSLVLDPPASQPLPSVKKGI